MGKSKWMWKQGDFERYHNMLLHNRRIDKGAYHNTMWRIDPPSCNVLLYKIVKLEKEEPFTAYANTDKASLIINDRQYKMGETITLQPGRNFIKISGFKKDGFPAFYCIGDHFSSDETWHLGSWGADDVHAGTNDMYTELHQNPEVFAFSYERMTAKTVEKTNGGTLYDFGKECFGKVNLRNAIPTCAAIPVFCGESREEALDTEEAYVRFDGKTENGSFTSENSVALRYIFIPDGKYSVDVSIDYEYLPIPDLGEFRSNDERVNSIWNVAAYTLHLNTREGYFDGIKRDRWIWGGDAYQSYFVNYYLMNDLDSVRRTQRMVHTASPMTMHVNTIPDYTFYWLSAMWEYYFHTGDLAFIQDMYPVMTETVRFVESRLDADGLYQRRGGDWMFVDWHEGFDKESGPLCAEQMLLCHAYECMKKLATLVGDGDMAMHCETEHTHIKNILNERYFDEEKGAYVDSPATGNRNVTRHANIFALLYDIAGSRREKQIIENVILNDKIPKITTPFFEFFELDAMCKIGNTKYMTDMLRSYWGGMLDMGATSFWEAYNPELSRIENYKMYGDPYGKSLCHAWGASPVYLLGRYALGVYPTSPAYKTFAIRPNLMDFKHFTGKVPTVRGNVEVTVNDRKITVLAEMDGGTLYVGDDAYSVAAGETLTVSLDN